MDESELLRRLSHKTGLTEKAAEKVLEELREMVHDGAVDQKTVLATTHRLPIAKDPEDPSLVEELIAKAKRHPLGLEFLLSGLLASVAIALGAHAFTVEAARARLRKEQALEPAETSTP